MKQRGSEGAHSGRQRREWQLFLFLVVVFFPLITVLGISAWGMAVWILQMIFGPPGPPGQGW